MNKVKMEIYDAHRDYDIELGLELLNTKIKIYGEEKGADVPYFEGTVGKFIKERIPSEEIVEMLPRLKEEGSIIYKLKTESIVIEKR